MPVEVETLCRGTTGRSAKSGDLGKNYPKLMAEAISFKKTYLQPLQL
jgi:hypothetical protein